MMKIRSIFRVFFLIVMMCAIFPSKEIFAKVYFATKQEMINNSSVIAVVSIYKTKKISKKVGSWEYRQKVSTVVNQVIKGKIPEEISIYGDEVFICAQSHFPLGQFLVFLKKDHGLWVASNWNYSIRPIKGNKVQWYKAKGDQRHDLEEQPLSKVLQELGVQPKEGLEAIQEIKALKLDFKPSEICEVHQVKMNEKEVPVRIGLPAPPVLNEPSYDIRQKSFPHAQEFVEGGCVPTPNHKTQKTLICPECQKSEKDWFKTHVLKK